MGKTHCIKGRRALGALFTVAVILLPFGLRSCAEGSLHIPLFPMKMDRGGMQQCSLNPLHFVQQLEQLLGSLAVTDSLLAVLFCALLCMARERRRLLGIVNDGALLILLYLKKIRSFIALHTPFLCAARVALRGLIPYKYPVFS